jgi:phenylacetate-coenzyme A ligase PaaK-like adenylate-forming protein
VALDCDHQRGLHVIDERAIAEVRTSRGSLARRGSGDLVVTNLENWGMPCIRYDIGDSATLVDDACECGFAGTTLTALYGRDATYFWISGRRFNPYRLNVIFELLPIQQFRVVQDGSREITIQWVPKSAATDLTAVNSLLAARFAAKTGVTADRVEPVRRIGLPSEKVQRYARLEAADRVTVRPLKRGRSSADRRRQES